MASRSVSFSATLGDWSSDGHGRTAVHQVEIYSLDGSEVTDELLKANYEANVAKLGFGLPALWKDYEQTSPREPQLIAIQRELGAIYYGEEDLAEQRSDLTIVPWAMEDDSEFGPNEFYIVAGYRNGELTLESDGEEDDLKLAMFLVLAGLPNLSWKILEPARPLFGDGGSLLTGNSHVGYGLFF